MSEESRTVEAEELNQALPAEYVEAHSHDAFAGVRASDLVHQMNSLFGPEGWSLKVIRTEVVKDETRVHPRDEQKQTRHVVASCVSEVRAKANGGEIVRQAIGTHTQQVLIKTPERMKAGDIGEKAVAKALEGAGTSAFKRAAYRIGRATGGELGEKKADELKRAGRGDRERGTSRDRGREERRYERPSEERRGEERRREEKGRSQEESSPPTYQSQSEEFKRKAEQWSARVREAKTGDEGKKLVEAAAKELEGMEADKGVVKNVVDRLEAVAGEKESW